MKSLKLISFAILIFYIMAGNDPVPSSGCGKDLSLPKTGSFEFSWSQGKRTVRIDIPDNYDNTKPYKLMFGMHCMGGWAGGVQQEGYYGLKPEFSLQDSVMEPCLLMVYHGIIKKF